MKAEPKGEAGGRGRRTVEVLSGPDRWNKQRTRLAGWPLRQKTHRLRPEALPRGPLSGETQLSLRNPHLVFFIPGIIRSPDFKSNGVFATRFGNENPLVGVWNLDARHDEYLLGDAFVDQDPVALAHHCAAFPLPPHEPRLPSPVSPGKPAQFTGVCCVEMEINVHVHFHRRSA